MSNPNKPKDTDIDTVDETKRAPTEKPVPLEPIEPGLFLSIAPSSIPSTNVGHERARRRKNPARVAPPTVPVRPTQIHPGMRGQVRPPQGRVTARRS